jgi:hypothetical protein
MMDHLDSEQPIALSDSEDLIAKRDNEALLAHFQDVNANFIAVGPLARQFQDLRYSQLRDELCRIDLEIRRRALLGTPEYKAAVKAAHDQAWQVVHIARPGAPNSPVPGSQTADRESADPVVQQDPAPASIGAAAPAARWEIGNQRTLSRGRTPRPLPPARRPRQAKREIGKQCILSCCRTSCPLPPARQPPQARWEIGNQRTLPCSRTPRPLPPARRSRQAKRQIGSQRILSCSRTLRSLPSMRQPPQARWEIGNQRTLPRSRTPRPLPSARCLPARSWQHGATRSSPLAIAGTMPSRQPQCFQRDPAAASRRIRQMK